MATCSGILAWDPWTEELGRLQSLGSESNMTEWTYTHTCVFGWVPWRQTLRQKLLFKWFRGILSEEGGWIKQNRSGREKLSKKEFLAGNWLAWTMWDLRSTIPTADLALCKQEGRNLYPVRHSDIGWGGPPQVAEMNAASGGQHLGRHKAQCTGWKTSCDWLSANTCSY